MHETIQQWAGQARQTAAGLFGNSHPIEVPADCPKELSKRIEAFNAKAGQLAEQQTEAVELIAGGPLAVADLDVSAKAVADSGRKAAALTYDLLADEQRLAGERAEVLVEVLDVLRGHVEKADGRLESEREKARKMLTKNGLGAEDDPRYAVDPSGSAVRFNHRVEAVASVREARDALVDARAQADAAAGALQATKATVASIVRKRLAAAERLGMIVG